MQRYNIAAKILNNKTSSGITYFKAQISTLKFNLSKKSHYTNSDPYSECKK